MKKLLLAMTITIILSSLFGCAALMQNATLTIANDTDNGALIDVIVDGEEFATLRRGDVWTGRYYGSNFQKEFSVVARVRSGDTSRIVQKTIILWARSTYGYYGGQSIQSAVTLTVRGNAHDGYRFDGPDETNRDARRLIPRSY